jgi:hypothetical protein
MPVLSDGAVELPMAHVSVRVAWHDTDWTGRVCTAPGANHSCTVLKNVKENKDSVAEQAVSGLAWTEIDHLPPCVNERAGFMRSRAFTQERTHNYAWNPKGAHAHFAPTVQRMPPYSFEVTPFRWVMIHEHDRYSNPWGIRVDEALEERARGLMPFNEDTWIQDHRNQAALLDSFFSALRPRQSLVLIYAKDIPLVEEREPGERYLIGAGFVESVDPAVEWAYSKEGPLRSIMWERGVAHSIRPTFKDGFLLPYQRLLADPALQGLDLDQFVARTPSEHFDEFSYVSELVTQDGAIAALAELARVVELLPGVVDGPWDQVGEWITERLGEAWQARGPYPGMGPMLAAAGLSRGVLLARRVLDDLPDGEDPWTSLQRAISENRDGLVGRVARKAWEGLLADASRYRQLRVMSRFGLTVPQAKDLYDGLGAADVLDNPYVLYECALAPDLALTTIDRGLFPQDAQSVRALAADPVDDPITEPHDDRRVRAACIHVLEHAADEGHTLLDESGLRKRLSDVKLVPRCDPGDAAFAIAAEEFGPLLVEMRLAGDAGRGWQLERLAAVAEIIRAEVRSRHDSSSLDVEWKWAERIDEVLPAVNAPDVAEDRARAEKARALEVIVRGRISALIGPAGTGKTSMLEALCRDPAIQAGGILLLSPTGKAAVQLADRTQHAARTLAQFLGQHERWDNDSRCYYLSPGTKRFSGAKTVVIDEASMLTEEMLAATIDALTGVDRLILCGDPHQLPPIGAGRPFADLVAFLRDTPGEGGGVAQLNTRRRQSEAGADPERVLDDVAVASLFSLDAVLPGADEALARVLGGTGDGRIEIVSWSDESDLHRQVVEQLGAADGNLGSHTRGGICRSLGGECADDGLPRFVWGSAGKGAENWQILSPVRERAGGVTGINQLVRATWRANDPQLALRSRKFTSPLGADQVIFADKVMCLHNDHHRGAWDPGERQKCAGSVANGEIGIVVRPAAKTGKAPSGHTVEFSTQSGRQYTFWETEMNNGGERAEEWLELAYAVTVHKSQGSQFRVTLVVVPDPCHLLSPELLYTALTRQQDKVVLLKQGDLGTLRALASPSRSETARRLTCLFHAADPFVLGDGTVVDAAHVHRTARGDDLVRSKSEVIVADALHDLGLDYMYEAELTFPGEFPRRPDFTIARPNTGPVYWEHLGMLDLAGYRADWESRRQWYASHDILPWNDGGGSRGTLVWSDENIGGAGINSQAIRRLAQEVFGL